MTGDHWQGNPRPSIVRFPETGSMANWEGLPGDGAEAVARRLEKYGNHGVPMTVNFMATPGKQKDELLRDLEKTILALRRVPYVDRFELNISCPNTHDSRGKIDAREENLRMLESMLELVETHAFLGQEIYLKVSPDSTEEDVKDTLDVVKNYRIKGVTATNTTTNHRREYIPISLTIDGKQVGGASGNAVYEDSLRVQKLYQTWIKKLGLNLKIDAVGGVDSPERAQERINHGASGIQIYTPFVFKGPKLLRELRSHSYKI